MRKKLARGEHRLEDALEALSRALTASRAPWMVIGGIAIIARGVRRMTTDIDAVVRGDAISVEALIATLARHGIAPRIAAAAAFARANLVLLLRHVASGVDLDVSFGWTTFEHDALEACTEARYGRVKARMATAEDLVILKAVAARPKDLDDAATLLVLHPKIDIERVRRKLAALAALAEEPEIMTTLDAAIARARSATPRKRRAPTKKQSTKRTTR